MAAGPIFGQLNPAKMLYELRQVVQLFLSVATLEGTSDNSYHPLLGLEESTLKKVPVEA